MGIVEIRLSRSHSTVVKRGTAGAPTYLEFHDFYLQIDAFLGWAMLGSNQRPLPCEGSTLVCWKFVELAECLQMYILAKRTFSSFPEIYPGCSTVAAQTRALWR